MSKLHAAVTTGKTWVNFECIGGPFDGLAVSLWKPARNIVLVDTLGIPHEYLNMAVKGLTPVIAHAQPIGKFGKVIGTLEYSGYMTQEEFDWAKQLAGGA
jgi:hypothetical protein